jgi:hypothetical protein
MNDFPMLDSVRVRKKSLQQLDSGEEMRNERTLAHRALLYWQCKGRIWPISFGLSYEQMCARASKKHNKKMSYKFCKMSHTKYV